MIDITPVILCGGAGTRLWPLSRTNLPKQFLVLSGATTLFQQSVERLYHLANKEIHIKETLVVTNEVHRFMALDQLRETDCKNARILLEPCGRNTAPALTLAALHAATDDTDAILVVAPADHVMDSDERFQTALHQSISLAQQGAIVVLGIPPDRPETGFGYIHAAREADTQGAHRVLQFTEKPDKDTARTYLLSGDYHWNSGLFVLKASTWLAALSAFRPDMADATREAWSQSTIDDRFNDQNSHYRFVRPAKEAFINIPAESIDYAVIESCPDSPFPLLMLPLTCPWSDLGTWDAVWQTGQHDTDNNVALGDTLLENTKNTLVHATSRLVTMVNVENLLVVETPDAVLIANREQSQDVKKLLTDLEQMKRAELNSHRKEHRPWGWYDSLVEGPRFKVKHIMVKPGASLSLQMHHHRAEHWVIVKGTAEIHCGKKTLLLTENQSTYIPLGEIHRLSNPGTIPLEIIEIQSGSYLGEDDIVRLKDDYDR